tara:strand:- start:37 stop:582 length:546 start_codon:yes stop_codon:yes gene_type:complete
MNIKSLKIPEVLLITPDIHNDERGYFFEFFNENKFNECTGLSEKFVQDNISFSKKGVLRGLHFQKNPMEQGKLVGVISGEVFDVAVDIRRNSPSYGQWIVEKISSSNKRLLWIPPGFAHGFYTLTDNTVLLYKTTNFYSANHEKTIMWNDKNLNIQWDLSSEPILSKKDMSGEEFSLSRKT